MKLGLVGLDTSHVEAYADVFNNPGSPHHIEGFRITHAFAGGSEDFPLSINRVGKFTRNLQETHGVSILESPQAVARSVDAVLLTTTDGRRHPEQFHAIAPERKPTFIDKPFAVSTGAADEIVRTAARHGVRLFSSSNLRFSDVLTEAIGRRDLGAIVGVDVAGPLPLEATQPGFFWYGIHLAEMLTHVLGPNCLQVQVTSRADHEVLVGEWAGGRLGTMRGNRVGNSAFTAVIRRETGDQWVDVSGGTPPYVGLTRAMAAFFRGGEVPVPLDETVAIVRFIEGANVSRQTGERRVVAPASTLGNAALRGCRLGLENEGVPQP